MKRRAELRVERLEDRLTPATFGVAWPDAQHLTLSFAPDGTGTSPLTSNLFATLNTAYPGVDWQREILRAFQTWAVQANINIGVVADSGLAEGVAGPPQGDSRFGDIRILASALAPSSLAVALPFDPTAGNWSGDVRLNSSIPLGAGGYDLYSVFLHEAAHVFGLDHSTDPASPRYAAYEGTRDGTLTAGDIADLQALYGTRQQDAFDTLRSNDTAATASMLGGGGQPISADGDLTTRADVDWYEFRTSPATDFNIRLRTAGLSLLQGRIDVYAEDGTLLGSAVAGRPGEDLSVGLTGLPHGQLIRVRVSGETGDVFAIGGYRLDAEPVGVKVQSNNGNTGSPPVPDGNDTPSSATTLQPKSARIDPRFDYATRSTLDSQTDVDYFRFRSPKADGTNPLVMTVMAWATQFGTITPRLTVYEARGSNPVPLSFRPLVRDDGTTVLQVVGLNPNADYLVRVEGGPGFGTGNGDYFLGIDFGDTPAETATFAIDAPVGPEAVTHTVTLDRSQLYHLLLRNEAPPGGPDVTVEVRDAAGNLVRSMTAIAGDAHSFTDFFTPGDYQFIVRSTTGGAYSLWGTGLTDPIGPHALNPVTVPTGGPAGPPAGGGSAGGTGSGGGSAGGSNSGSVGGGSTGGATGSGGSTAGGSGASGGLGTGGTTGGSGGTGTGTSGGATPDGGYLDYVVARPGSAASASSPTGSGSAVATTAVATGSLASVSGVRVGTVGGTIGFQLFPGSAALAGGPTVFVAGGAGFSPTDTASLGPIHPAPFGVRGGSSGTSAGDDLSPPETVTVVAVGRPIAAGLSETEVAAAPEAVVPAPAEPARRATWAGPQPVVATTTSDPSAPVTDPNDVVGRAGVAVGVLSGFVFVLTGGAWVGRRVPTPRVPVRRPVPVTVA